MLGAGGVLGLACFRIFIKGGGERESAADADPAIQVTANELYAAYDANEVAADNRYRGKSLLVTGTVREVGKGSFDQPYVTLLFPQLLVSERQTAGG